MFENNKDFYPTPKNIIDKMLSGLDLSRINSVLEPSAGNGNIAEALKEKAEKDYHRNRGLDIDCIEIDKNLQHILRGNGFRVVHDDFLTYETMKEYDLIAMNPPFSNGCKHLLKALKMQERNGGAVICLLNAETLKNPYTNERMDLKRKLEEYNADIEYIQDAFLDAERETRVEVAMVKVQLPEVKRKSFILEGLKKAQEEKEYKTAENTQVADGDFFRGIVNQYKLEVEAGIKLIKEYYAMEPFILSSFEKDEKTGETVQTGGCMLSLKVGGKTELSVNNYVRAVRGKYWSALFKNPKFTGQLTYNMQRDFYNKVQELKDYDFSLYNIYTLKTELINNVVQGIEDTIIELFDELSHKHCWYDETSKNIHYYNGWKTNKAWIINKKVIIPLNGFNSWGDFSPAGYTVLSKLQDMEKCFNYLDGGLTDAVNLREALQFAEEYGETKNIQLKYFTVTFYKKGTCHITFNNEDLLKKFNIFGSQHKGWLPPSYGEKGYKDMTAEEKIVIDAFEGEKEYNKVVANRDYYLFDSNKLNLLEEKTA